MKKTSPQEMVMFRRRFFIPFSGMLSPQLFRKKLLFLSGLEDNKISVCAILTLCITAGAYQQHVPFLGNIPGPLMAKMLFILASPVIFWCGWEFMNVKPMKKKEREMHADWLIGLSALLLFGYSAFITFFPESVQAPGGQLETEYDSASFIIAASLLGRRISKLFWKKRERELEAFQERVPKKVHAMINGRETAISSGKCAIGDSAFIRAGEIIPFDGVIVDGFVTADESFLTGDASIQDKNIGDEVLAGTRVREGKAILRITRRREECIARLLSEMIQQGQARMAPMQKSVRSLAIVSAPAALAIAFVFGLFLFFAGDGMPFMHVLLFGAAVIIILEPRTLADSANAVFSAAIGAAAKQGIFIRNPCILEITDRAEVMALPLAGIITRGMPILEEIASADGKKNKRDILRLAFSMERTLDHPLALAVKRSAKDENIMPLPVSSLSQMGGKGAEGMVKIDGITRQVFIGSRRSCLEHAIGIRPALEEYIVDHEKERKIVVLLALEKEVIGILLFRDDVVSYAETAVSELQAHDKHIMLLTGISEMAARSIAENAGIGDIHAEMTIREKRRFLKKLRGMGLVVIAAGNEKKDEKVILQAHASLFASRDYDLIRESRSDAVCFGEACKGVMDIAMVSRSCMKRARWNVICALVFILALLPLAVGILVPFGGPFLHPIAAVLIKTGLTGFMYPRAWKP